jgi:PAS domain S-box-containing protein
MPKIIVNKKNTLDYLQDFDLKSLNKVGEWKELFLGLFEVSRELIFILNEEGNIISINQYGAGSLDFSVKELIGKHFADIVDGDYLQLVNSSLNIALKNDYSFFETALVTKFEKVLRFQINVRTVKSGEKIIGLLGMGKNVTRQRKFEDEVKDLYPKLIETERLIALERSRSNHNKIMLDELNRMKGEFVSNISHELRTPLASIVGFSETIASDPNMPDEMKAEFNLIILNEGKRLAKLINDVLDLSRMETGSIVLNKNRFDITLAVQKSIDEFRKIANEKNIIITSEIPTQEIIIEADEERISQIIEALLDNAFKFTSAGGRVKVILNNLFREIEIIVADTGIGVPEKDLPYLFQKFYRVNRTDSDLPGAGLGLVFVKQIVDLHKGLITIQSEPNRGTSVIIKLLKNIHEKN